MLNKIGYLILGLLLAIMGSIGTLIGIISIIDPMGTKMADDNSPFTSSPYTRENISITPISIVIFIFGAYLLFSSNKNK